MIDDSGEYGSFYKAFQKTVVGDVALINRRRIQFHHRRCSDKVNNCLQQSALGSVELGGYLVDAEACSATLNGFCDRRMFQRNNPVSICRRSS